MSTLFGSAGIPLSCKGSNIDGLKHSIKLGLRAYEVEFVRGVRMSERMASEMQRIVNENKVVISCHAPYYLNCNNPDKYSITKRHLLDCLRVNEHLRFNRVVFHVGYLMGLEREVGLKNSIKTIGRIIEKARSEGLKDFTLGPELAGKKSQIGSVNELIQICKEFKECKPVIDWGHLHAFTNGGLKAREDFLAPIELIETELGKKYVKGLHCHFSENQYTDKGEWKHQPLGTKWGPDFKILAELIKEKGYEFTIISETPFIEADALKMKKILSDI